MVSILVIDSDLAMLSRLDTQLSDEGYAVQKAASIDLAGELFAEHQPDLVLLEVSTGRGAGWHLLKQLAPLVPVIVVSGEGREEHVVRGLEYGAVDYIAKPYRSAELLTRVRMRMLPQANGARTAEPAAADAVALPAEGPTTRLDTPEATEPGSVLSQPLASDAASADTPPRDEAAPPEETVFMSDSEELALLRASDEAPVQEEAVLTEGGAFGERLRVERQRRRMTLVQVENSTHIRMWYLQAIEEEKFTLLPRGTIATRMIHDYASHLGMDADAVVAEFEQLHPSNQAEFVPAFQLPRQFRPPRWIFWAAAVLLALAVTCTGIYLFDPDGMQTVSENIRSMFSGEPAPTLETPLEEDASSTSGAVPVSVSARLDTQTSPHCWRDNSIR